ncbi:hypothetical protein LIER_27210 [Lithospermum erythrorhizon]|uniref:Uncharacterized protein n=1 Tax=Lithospermum erythrorhizon TaxID=34254 RepID=A0AAV3RBH2_LITER
MKKTVKKSRKDWVVKIVAVNEGLAREDNMRLKLQELDSLDEYRLAAQQRLECYQSRIPKAYDKKVKVQSYQVGHMVLDVIRPIHMRAMNAKLMPKWDRPYLIQEPYPSVAYLMTQVKNVGPINDRYLKRYYP